MKKILLFFLFSILCTGVWSQSNAWINEFHYDNNGADQDEFIEIVIENAGGLTLSDFVIDLYNGYNNESYKTVTMDNFTTGITVGNFTVYSHVFSTIQNGSPDGISLTYQNTLISGQFLSYEGSITATDGPANGETSTDILVTESGSTAVGHSLQLTGTGTQYSDFTWVSPVANTIGVVNNNQIFGTAPTDTDPPVWITDYPYVYSIFDTKGQIAVSLDEPGKVYYIVLYDGATAPDAEQVIAGQPYDTVTVCVHDSIDVSVANTEYLQWIEDATSETPYDIYVVAQDTESTPNIQTTPVLLECTTIATKSLAFTNPQYNDTVYVGDTLTFEWDAVKVDSILIRGYDYADSSDFMVTIDEYENPAPVAADTGYFTLWIPYEANRDSVKFYLYDAEETELYVDSLLIYLIDTIPPMIDKTTPANGSTGFTPAGQFTLYFTENVTVGAGNIYLFEANGTPVDTFNVTDIYFDQNLFSFKPEFPLEPGTEYYFEIDAGIVTDWKDTEFEEITDSNTWSFTVASNELYFSEYIEGSSYNKALEIYNPTNETVDLSKYGIAKSTNGESWQDPDPLTGILDPGDVYVIINPGFDFSLIDSATVVDTIWGGATNHNGNDGRALAKLIEGSWDEDHTFSFIDVIGYNDGNPGPGWDVADVTTATKDHTLIRKAAISIGNTDFTESAGTNTENSEWRVLSQDFFTNLGYATPDASSETNILGFVLKDTPGNNITDNTIIDTLAYSVDVEILYCYGSVIDSLVPEITLSEGATSYPASGDTVDFTLPATFTVTAEDKLITQEWTVTVALAAAKSTETDILVFTVDNQIGNALIDTTTHTVTTEVEYLTDLITLTPDIEISSFATIVPLSGIAQNFTDPVIYTVTAEDGTTIQEWTITISEEIIPYMSIYDIQYTTETSGDSPHINEQVRVSGIVTAIDSLQDFKGYFLQDSTSTWNGIYVYDPDHNSTKSGDSLTIVATIDEYYNVTQISGIVEYFENSTGNILPDPLVITTGITDPEQYEGVLVTIENAECTNNNLGNDEVEINDGSGVIIVNDYIYDYIDTVAFTKSNIYRITGVMYYSSGDYKIIPRNVNDIEDVTAVNDLFTGVNIHIYPNPNNGLFRLIVNNIKSGSPGIEIMNIHGQILFRNVINNPTGFSESIDLTKFGKGLYLLRINDGNNTKVKKILIR